MKNLKKVLVLFSMISLISCNSITTNNTTHKYEKVFYNIINEKYKVYTDDYKKYNLELITANGLKFDFPLTLEKSASGIILTDKKNNIEISYEEGKTAFVEENGRMRTLYEKPVKYKLYKKLYTLKNEVLELYKSNNNSNTVLLKFGTIVEELKRVKSASGEMFLSNDWRITVGIENGKNSFIELDARIVRLFENKLNYEKYTAPKNTISMNNIDILIAKINDDEFVMNTYKDMYFNFVRIDSNSNEYVLKDNINISLVNNDGDLTLKINENNTIQKIKLIKK